MSISTAEALIGKTVRWYTVLGVEPLREYGEAVLRVRCEECKGEVVRRRSKLLNKKLRSCGCLRKALRARWAAQRMMKGIEPRVEVVVPEVGAPIELDHTLGMVVGMPTVVARLNYREQLVCDEFLLHGDRRKAISKVYSFNSPDAQKAHKKLTEKVGVFFSKPAVRNYIVAEQKKIQERYAVQIDNVMQELIYLAKARITDFCEIVDGVLTIFDTSELSKEQAAAIESFKQDKLGTVQIKMYNKIEAARLVGEHTGAFPKKVEFTGRFVLENTDFKTMSNEEVKAIARDPRIALAAGSNN